MTGAQFEIRIDGTPRTYRDRKDFAMETARFLKSKNPHSMNRAGARKPGGAGRANYKWLGSRDIAQ
jgi:hypothetical protein